MDSQPSAPPVVTVVVAKEQGDWLEECLAALGAQDYPNQSVLVVDAGIGGDPAPRVAAVLPDATWPVSSNGTENQF
jgi:cellulose synthase/poly-beta-1,6-N-acetylglucosamine synthase-like glycosyltransferase